jgi:hypothetical protein
MEDSLLKIIDFYKKVNNSVWTEWIFRILISLVFIKNVVVIQEEYYPDSAWAPTLIALWLYFFKQRLIGLIPLILAMLIHYFHVSPEATDKRNIPEI